MGKKKAVIPQEFQHEAFHRRRGFPAYGNVQLPPFALLSNVSLTGPVPEPATWAPMLLGFGGLGAKARRRRAVSLAA